MFLELGDFGIDLVSRSEGGASTSILLLLNQLLDLSVIAVVFVLLNRLGRLVLGLFGTDGLLVFDKGLEAVVSRSRAAGASAVDFSTTGILHRSVWLRALNEVVPTKRA